MLWPTKQARITTSSKSGGLCHLRRAFSLNPGAVNALLGARRVFLGAGGARANSKARFTILGVSTTSRPITPTQLLTHQLPEWRTASRTVEHYCCTGIGNSDTDQLWNQRGNPSRPPCLLTRLQQLGALVEHHQQRSSPSSSIARRHCLDFSAVNSPRGAATGPRASIHTFTSAADRRVSTPKGLVDLLRP
jgi:hypothetical protein